MRHQWKLYMYGIAPTLGGYAFGYDTGSISGILTMDHFNEYFKNPSNSLQGGITSSIQAGAFVGSLLTGLLIADQLGRRWTLIIGASVFTIGIATTCGSNNIYALIAGRVINGLGLGVTAMGVPLFQSEISPPQIRGRIISLQQCVINFGILSSFLIQYGCSHINSNASWRLPLGIQLIPTALLTIVMIFMPESPRWLMAKGHPEKALETLARVHANGDITDSFVVAEYEEIKATLEMERHMKKPSYFEILFSKEHGRRTILAMSVQFFQQAVGINSIMYYAPFLFQQAGVGSTEASLLSNVIQGVILNVVTWPNMYYLDTWGRRRPLVLGAIGMGVCMLLIGVIMKTVGHPQTNPDTNKVEFDFSNNLAAGKAVIAFLYLYVAAFAISWATPAWVVPAEILTMAARARANSLSTATNWFVNFWFALYIPTALERISWRLYIMFAGISFLAAIVCYLFQPETANRTLEQMSFMFEPDKSIWVFTDRDLTDVHPRFNTLEQRAEKYAQEKEAIEHMENPEV